MLPPQEAAPSPQASLPASLPPAWPAPRSRGTSSALPQLTLSSSKLISPSSSVSRSSGSSPAMARSSVGAPRGRRRLRRRWRGDSMGQGRRLSCCSRLSLCFLAKFTNTCKGGRNSGWSPGLASPGRGLGWWGQKGGIWGLPRWTGLPIILSQPMTPGQRAQSWPASTRRTEEGGQRESGDPGAPSHCPAWSG